MCGSIGKNRVAECYCCGDLCNEDIERILNYEILIWLQREETRMYSDLQPERIDENYFKRFKAEKSLTSSKVYQWLVLVLKLPVAFLLISLLLFLLGVEWLLSHLDKKTSASNTKDPVKIQTTFPDEIVAKIEVEYHKIATEATNDYGKSSKKLTKHQGKSRTFKRKTKRPGRV